MGKTVEYPIDFKLNAIKTYLDGSHGRLPKGIRNVWNERYKSIEEVGKTISRIWRRFL